VVARPDSVDRLVENPLATRDLKRRSFVFAAAHEDVVDPPEGPVPADHDRVVRGEGVTRLARMRALPGVAIADTHALQGLPPGPEPRACGRGIGVQVGGENNVQAASAVEFVQEASGLDRLQLALVGEVQLPARVVEGKEQRPNWLGREHFGGEDAAGEPLRPRRQMQVELPHLAERPPARE
jgi:hypothetical protein